MEECNEMSTLLNLSTMDAQELSKLPEPCKSSSRLHSRRRTLPHRGCPSEAATQDHSIHKQVLTEDWGVEDSKPASSAGGADNAGVEAARGADEPPTKITRCG
eukprot:2627381-Amphidinium_carterae.1